MKTSFYTIGDEQYIYILIDNDQDIEFYSGNKFKGDIGRYRDVYTFIQWIAPEHLIVCSGI